MPTRYRPLIFKRMFESWRANSVCSDLIIGLQNDDEDLAEYLKVIAGEPADKSYYIMLDNIGLAGKYNELYRQFPNYEAYALLNDDHIFRTPNWDSLIMARLKSLQEKQGHKLHIISWQDGWMNDLMPAGFCTKELLEIIKTPCPVGYMSHVFIDNTYQMLAGFAGIGEYMPEIMIEHMHPEKGKGEIDKNYTGHLQKFDYDYDGYMRWLREKCLENVEEIFARKKLAYNNLSIKGAAGTCTANVL